MKVTVIGANGQIGRKLVALLQQNPQYSVRAAVRKTEQQSAFQQSGVESVLLDLEQSVSHIAQAIAGSDAVVFTAGSGGHTGADKTLLVDLDGAVKSIEAAQQVGVERFIMVSAIQAHRRENWNEKIRHYFVAKHYADRILVQSTLNYTIIRPGGLTNEKGTGNITIAENLERGLIPREDVAAVIVASLNEKAVYRRSFDLVSGQTPIAEALQTFS